MPTPSCTATRRDTPDVAVFYLHPTRQVFEVPWERCSQSTGGGGTAYRQHGGLVRLRSWSGGILPPGDTSYCRSCKHEASGACVNRFGPKNQGSWDQSWQALASALGAPTIDVNTVEAEAEPEVDDDDDADAKQIVLGHPRAADGDVLGRRTLPVGLHVGQTDTGDPVVLDPQVLRTHVAVVGAAGSGKTWMAKVLAEEALRAGTPVLAIDPQGELGADDRRASAGGHPRTLLWDSWHQLQEMVDVRIVTPGTSHGIRLSLDPLRLPNASDLSHIENEELPSRRGGAAGERGGCEPGGSVRRRRGRGLAASLSTRCSNTSRH